MLVAVTGATGHLGNNLIRQLISQGYRVRAVVRDLSTIQAIDGIDMDIKYGDINDFDSLENSFKGVEQVFHLAGLVSIMPRMHKQLHKINVSGTINVIEACKKFKVRRLVYVSSIHAIPLPPEGETIDERSPLNPKKIHDGYGQSKALATQAVLEECKKGALDAVVLCPTGIIGPFDFKGSSIGKVIQMFIKNKIPAYLPGGYDLVDVRDVANSIQIAGEIGKIGQHYILSGQQVLIKDMFLEIQRVTGIAMPRLQIPANLAKVVGSLAGYSYSLIGKDSLITSYSVATLLSNHLISSSLAYKDLNFNPRKWEISLRDQIEWIVENGLIR